MGSAQCHGPATSIVISAPTSTLVGLLDPFRVIGIFSVLNSCDAVRNWCRRGCSNEAKPDNDCCNENFHDFFPYRFLVQIRSAVGNQTSISTMRCCQYPYRPRIGLRVAT